MNFNQLADETFAESWERYHGLMIDLPTVGMEDWEFTQGFYCGLSQEAKEHIDTLARATFFMLNAEEARALFEKLSASERESEEHGSKKNSRTVEIDPITNKFQSMAFTQPAVGETRQAE
jgi:translation elongation factor EF-G